MKIAIGNDHAGFMLKNTVIEHIKQLGHEVIDVGCHSEESCDYPIYAKKTCSEVVEKRVELGILICGTGVGMSIAANKVKGIRASLCSDIFTAQMTREHNNSNVLVLAGRVISKELAINIIEKYLETKFSGDERHNRRLAMLEDENDRV